MHVAIPVLTVPINKQNIPENATTLATCPGHCRCSLKWI